MWKNFDFIRIWQIQELQHCVLHDLLEAVGDKERGKEAVHPYRNSEG